MTIPDFGFGIAVVVAVLEVLCGGLHDGIPRFSPTRVIPVGAAGLIKGTGWVALAPDGGLLACSQHVFDGRRHYEVVAVLDLKKGERKYLLYGHMKSVTGLAFSEDGKQLTSVSLVSWDRPTANQALQWDMSNGENTKTTMLDGGGGVLALGGGGRVMVTRSGFPNPIAKAWDLATGKAVALEGHTKNVMRAIISANGRRIATIGDPREELIVWDFPTGKKVCQCEVPRSLRWHYRAVAFSHDGRQLIVASERETLFFDLPSEKPRREPVGISPSDDNVQFTADDKLIAFSCLGVRLWSPTTRKAVAVLIGNKRRPSPPTGVPMFSTDGRVAVSVLLNSSYPIYVWDMPKLAP